MEDYQRAVIRSLEVVKSRGQSHQMGRHTFRIINGHGLQVHRRVQGPGAGADHSRPSLPQVRKRTASPNRTLTQVHGFGRDL